MSRRIRTFKSAARGIVVQRGRNEFVVLGVGFGIRFIGASGQGIPVSRVERGRFVGDQWQRILPMRRESEDRTATFGLVEAQVVKAVLELP